MAQNKVKPEKFSWGFASYLPTICQACLNRSPSPCVCFGFLTATDELVSPFPNIENEVMQYMTSKSLMKLTHNIYILKQGMQN